MKLFFSPKKLLLAAILASGCGACAQAQMTLYWDPAGTGLGGSGTLTYNNSSNTVFNTAADGSGSQVADTSAANSLVFGGTGGTVTLGAILDATTLTFNTSTSPYTVSNGGSNSIASSLVFAGSSDVTMGAAVIGSGNTVLQSGTGTTTYTAKIGPGLSVTVDAGTLITTGLSSGDPLTVSGGTYEPSVASISISNVTLSSGALTLGTAGQSTIKIAGGDTFTMTGGTINLSVGTTSGSIAGVTNAAKFNITGGTLALILGSGFSYSNTYNIFSGFGSSSTLSGLSITGYDTSNYQATLSNAGVLSFSPSAVPEPSTYALIMGGAALAAAFWRRRAVAA